MRHEDTTQIISGNADSSRPARPLLDRNAPATDDCIIGRLGSYEAGMRDFAAGKVLCPVCDGDGDAGYDRACKRCDGAGIVDPEPEAAAPASTRIVMTLDQVEALTRLRDTEMVSRALDLESRLRDCGRAEDAEAVRYLVNRVRVLGGVL